ncbi:hypothetical protein FB382_002501 [Nocardioides ginsengisegetis]|uniref:PPE family protein n=1 Tax=Nocardioides ginsengisegetis TaxID=661491 RepID=A0A7W3P9Y7_9ACTN|nr:hypothetical protein [Nocardioides ginsengisegetis]MBA8804210.1 hypothetical protein [Nocardioides ginsengisegetis]
MSGNDLVVGAVDSSTAFTGAGALESLVGTANALENHDWVEASVMGVATGLETLGAIADPFGALVSAGIGWLIEHLEPFPTWLDQLAGSPDQIHAFASTWGNIATRVHDSSSEFLDAVGRASSEWDGVAIDAYRTAARAQAAIIDGFGSMVSGVAGATEAAGAIVAGVREIVRDAISQLIGYGLSKAVQLLTVALAPKAIAEISAKVAEWAARISAFVKGLVKSMGNLSGHLDELLRASEELGGSVKSLSEKWAKTSVGNAEYDFDRIFAGGASPGHGMPSLANITYQGGSGAVKHTVGLDDRPN